MNQSGWLDLNQRSPAPTLISQSTQRSRRAHIRPGKAAGSRYIMGAKQRTKLSKIESTGWDSNPDPRQENARRITGAASSPLDDQRISFSGIRGARTLTDLVKSQACCR
jgi:hypothetical protein